MNLQNFLQPTALLNFNHPTIKALINDRLWASMPTFDAIGAVYDYVRNDIKFGYNRTDAIAASEVLKDGYGQCNTKAILLMALFRAIGVPTRLHGFTIIKDLQRGVVPEIVYPIAPKNIVHSWVEIFFNDKWINLEGFILDDAYLNRLQNAFGDKAKSYCGYGVGTENLLEPQVKWVGTDTYIQNTAINQDFGVFATPDEFYKDHRQDLSWLKGILYSKFLRHWMNARVERIRHGGKIAPLPECELGRS